MLPPPLVEDLFSMTRSVVPFGHLSLLPFLNNALVVPAGG